MFFASRTRLRRRPPMASPRPPTAFCSQPANCTSTVVLARVLDGEVHHRGGQAGIRRIERNEGRKGLQRSRSTGNPSALYSTVPIGYSPRKATLGKPTRSSVRSCDLAVRFDADGEALIERRFRLGRMGIVAVAGADDLIENVPMPELAVAAEIELAGAEAADRHSDQRRFRRRDRPPASPRAVRARTHSGDNFLSRGTSVPASSAANGPATKPGLDDERERADAEELEEVAAMGSWLVVVHSCAFYRRGGAKPGGRLNCIAPVGLGQGRGPSRPSAVARMYLYLGCALVFTRSVGTRKLAGQGRKAATARDRGLSALPSSALTGVDRLLAFFTSFPFIPRFCLDLLAPELCSGTPSAIRCFADGRRRANTKRHYYTERRGNLPCQLRPIQASGEQAARL